MAERKSGGAAGLIFFVLIGGLIGWMLHIFWKFEDRPMSGDSFADLYGTVVDASAYKEFNELDDIPVTFKDISGTFKTKDSENLVVVEVFLKSNKMVQTRLDFKETGLAVSAVSHITFVKDSYIEADKETIVLNNNGENQYLIVFRKIEPKPKSLPVKLSANDHVVFSKFLRTY